MKAINVAIYALVFWFLSLTAANAQTDYSIETRTLSGSFTSVQTDGKVEVTIVRDSVNKVEVYAPVKIIAKVETKVENGVFTVYLKKRPARHEVKLTLHCSGKIVNLDAKGDSEIEARILSGKDLTLNASEGSEIDVKKVDATGKLTIDAQSGADVDIDAVSANELLVKATSGADVDLKGNAQRAELNASAGAEIDVEEMRFDNINARATSGGWIKR